MSLFLFQVPLLDPIAASCLTVNELLLTCPTTRSGVKRETSAKKVNILADHTSFVLYNYILFMCYGVLGWIGRLLNRNAMANSQPWAIRYYVFCIHLGRHAACPHEASEHK